VVEDDGTGFQVNGTESMRTGEWHYGLLGMQERAAMIGGYLRIESDPGEGTTVVLEVKCPLVS
jgi:signal transduction histidine kinase